MIACPGGQLEHAYTGGVGRVAVGLAESHRQRLHVNMIRKNFRWNASFSIPASENREFPFRK